MQIGQNLAAEKTRAIAEIEAAVEAFALAYMPSPARAAIYMRKEAEAKSLLAAVARSEAALDADYPLLAVDADIAGSNLQDAAEIVLARADEWAALARSLEALRRRAKIKIAAARSFQAARDSLAAARAEFTASFGIADQAG